MPDAVGTQVLINGSRLLSLKLTNISDGTGEAAVIKVDVSAYGCGAVRIRNIEYDIQGMSVSLLWAANAPVVIGTFSGYGEFDPCGVGSISNNAGAGKTGDMLLTTNNASAGSSYTVTIDMEKVD